MEYIETGYEPQLPVFDTVKTKQSDNSEENIFAYTTSQKENTSDDFFLDGYTYSFEHNDTVSKKGFFSKVGEFLSSIGDFFSKLFEIKSDSVTSRKNLKTRDGIIKNTKQGQAGDCWFLASINALSYTQAGKEIIKDAYYSSGDDDMLILELAAEKAHKDASECNFKAPSVGKKEIGDGSYGSDAFYLLTGKKTQSGPSDEKCFKDGLLDCFEKFQKNGNKDLAITLTIEDDTPDANYYNYKIMNFVLG